MKSETKNCILCQAVFHGNSSKKLCIRCETSCARCGKPVHPRNPFRRGNRPERFCSLLHGLEYFAEATGDEKILDHLRKVKAKFGIND